MRIVAFAVAVLLLPAAGCGGTDPKAHPVTSTTPTNSLVAPVPVGTLTGRLVAVGGPSQASDKTLAGTITITGPGGSVLHADVGSNGVFQIQLPPGSYRLSARSKAYNGGTTDCLTATPVTTLIANRTVSADIVCQRR